MRLKRLAGAVVLLAVAAMLVAIPAQAKTLDCSANFSFDRDWSAYEGKNVALVVHGWTGTPMRETASLLASELPASEWVVDTFSYENANGDWPGEDSQVAECLRATLLQYAGATERTGPSIYLVTHSMGGIVARVALNRGKDPQLDDLVGGVITIDTPHRGSPWGGSDVATLAQFIKANSAGDGLPADLCLALHHPGPYPPACDSPPAVSTEIPILQVAGSATLVRTFFHIKVEKYDLNSDGVVWMDSQAGYRNSVDSPQPPAEQASSSVVRCEVLWKDTLGNGVGGELAGFSPSALEAMRLGTADIVKHPLALQTLYGVMMEAPCGHTKMTTNLEAITRVSAQLMEWAKSNVDGWRISADGIGALEVGKTTWDEVSALPGFEGDASYWGEVGCVTGGWFGVGVSQDGLGVLVAGPEASPGAIDVVSLGSYFRTGKAADIPVSTSEGIQLGTSEADVIRLHPEAKAVTHPLSEAITDYQVEDGNGRAIVFGVENAVVTYITVGNVPEVYAIEGCA
ncbi:triacylglycerol lipase [Microbacterium sp. W4I20]|uniref:esterase/lipase family protein n=1 Tax=Microbacterium sp. W4I20 TaxID=3042262 RepID=UPI00277DFF54|nr:hypothetical protein [Microbacterium sp. W4I20]MDQ0728843.1 pimeloyl-ACP methyl ester carboxylesterase [Microbacterium sp. W4I20]